MDRKYYQLIEEGIEIARLTAAIVQNADWKPCVKVETDPIIIDLIKSLQSTQIMLKLVIKKQGLVLETSQKK